MNPLGNALFRSTNKEKHTCLTFPAHERTQSYLSFVDTDFYMVWGVPGVKDGWNREYAPIPDNHKLLRKSNNPLESLPNHLSWSFILSHAAEHWNVSSYLAKMGGLPIIQYWHCWPQEKWPQSVLDQYKTISGDINVFISRQSLNRWGFEENEQNIVIEHAVDSQTFIPMEHKQSKVLFQGNLIRDRSYILGTDIFFDKVVNAGLPYKIIGNNPGLTQAPPNLSKLVEEMNECSVYANFARESPLPMSLLEAMSCGLAPVSIDTCMASELIKHGENGFKSNDPEELQDYCRFLLENPGEAKRIGQTARQTIIDRFSLSNFVNNWNNVFDRASKLIYRG